MKKLTMITSIAIATLASQTVTAAPYSGLYVFGDSLFDSGGNATAIATGNGIPGVRATNLVGPTYQAGSGEASGRISPQFIADNLGVELTGSEFSGTNYAVGAHRSADTLESVTTLGGKYSAPAGEFNSYFYDLSLNGGSVDPNAMYLLNGGGNDLGALTSGVLTAFDIANNLTAAAKALADNGANYIVVADVPNFSVSPTASVLPSFLIDTLNGIIDEQNASLVSQISALDANIVLLNTYQFSQELFADPSAFGFNFSSEELSANCFDADACGGPTTEGNRNSANPNPDLFFFNDSLHFTTLGNKVFADYINSVLNAGSELALLPSLAMDSVQAQWQAARPTMRANRWGSNLSDDDSKFSVYGTLQQSENNRDTLIGRLEGDNEAQSYHVGVNFHASNNAYFGVLLGRSDNELNVGVSQYEMTSTDISFLGAYNNDAYFVEAIYTFSDNDYRDLDRSFSLGPLNQRTETGNTGGNASSLAIQAGYDIFKGQENYRLGPIVGYEYIDVTVEAYQEDASLSTSLVVGEQNVSSSVLLAGIFGSIGLGICDCEFYGEAVYRDEDKDGRNDVELGLVTVGSNRFSLPGQSLDNSSITVDLGFNASLTESLSLNVSAGASDSDDNDSLWYGATLSFDL
ncbi:MAG: outer membrane lipase/esterase [Chitinophagales bacterium]|jgi:outer membrane lipase/esterase